MHSTSNSLRIRDVNKCSVVKREKTWLTDVFLGNLVQFHDNGLLHQHVLGDSITYTVQDWRPSIEIRVFQFTQLQISHWWQQATYQSDSKHQPIHIAAPLHTPNRLLQQSTFRRYAAIVLSPFFYFCCFRRVIMLLSGVINYVFCIYNTWMMTMITYHHWTNAHASV